MSPTFPLAPASPLGNPAPFWFIVTFKVLGFTLHMGPMHIWYAGSVLVALFTLFGRGHARHLASRLAGALPILIALGVNFGIVPLLFVQVGYYPVVYPANILIAWFWFAVIPLLIVAYYGTYYYVAQIRRGRVDRTGVAASVASALAFLTIGFFFSNNFSLMTNKDQMLAIYDRTSVGGAVSGLALNVGDPTLLPRWLMMFGLAITTTAAYVLLDTVFFAREEAADYRRWAARFAVALYAGGVVWFAAFGSWYIFGALRPEIRQAMLAQRPILLLAALTAVAPGAVWLLLVRASQTLHRTLAWGVGAMQFVVLALNAITRQWVQNTELSGFFDPAALRVQTQWSPLIVFLVIFALALGVVAWMVSQVLRSPARPPAG